MKIVIKIPDDFYERVNKDGCMSYTDAEVVVNAFYCGEVLPKGHGRLVDEYDVMESYRMGEYDLNDCPTIIEADEEVGK